MESDSVEKPKNVATFFISGVLVYFEQLIVISSAQDILAGTFIPTSVILVALTIPASLINTIGPFCFQKVWVLLILLVLLTDSEL